jgi:hypothetical protein
MSNLRYSELKHDGQIYTEQWKIDEILIDNKFNWMVNAEIKNARLEIFKETLVWNGGIWYNGDWYFGVWRDGEWRYGNWQNGVWYSGVWKNGTFKSGIIYNGKFFKGQIEGGEIRGGVFINVEISPNVVEYTSDEYQAKRQEEIQPEKQTTTAVAQSNQPVGQVRVNGTKPAAQQIQNTEQPKIQNEKLRYIKTFESFSENELNEGFKDIINKVINYGKKGILTAVMLLSLAASSQVQAEGKSEDVITIGVKHIYKVENQNLNAALAAISERYAQICLNNDDEENYDNFILLRNYYLNLRDAYKNTQVPNKALSCQKILLNSLDKFINGKDKSSIMTLIDEGMSFDNDSYKLNTK